MCGTIGTVNRRDNVAAMIGTAIAALPDLKATEQVVVAESDYVFVWGVVEGTHRGDFFGVPPTGGKLHFDAPDLYRITDGKTAKEWAARLAILAELGVYTPARMQTEHPARQES
jgi:predicted ester cyclase